MKKDSNKDMPFVEETAGREGLAEGATESQPAHEQTGHSGVEKRKAEIAVLLKEFAKQLEYADVVRAEWARATYGKGVSPEQHAELQSWSDQRKLVEEILARDAEWQEIYPKLESVGFERIQYLHELKQLLDRQKEDGKGGYYMDWNVGHAAQEVRLEKSKWPFFKRIFNKRVREAYQEKMADLQKDVDKYDQMAKDFHDPEIGDSVDAFFREYGPLEQRAKELRKAAWAEAEKSLENQAAAPKAPPMEGYVKDVRTVMEELEEELASLEGN